MLTNGLTWNTERTVSHRRGILHIAAMVTNHRYQ